MKTQTLTPMILAAAALFGSASAVQAQHWSFDVAPGGVLEVDLETGGAVEIRGGAGDQVVVDADVHGRDADKIRVTAEKQANGVRVHAEYTGRSHNVSGGADLTVTVPAKFDLDLSTTGGQLHIEGVDGRMTGQTMGGGLELRDLRGHLSLSTMGGNVTFHRVSGGLKGTTMGGRVRILDAPADAAGAAAGASGSDKVVEISTMGGEIDVASAPRGADVSTMGGDITIGSAKQFVKARTMGGKIRIDAIDGRVDATTMGGDVAVHVVGAGGDVAIESMSGDLELWLPAGFDAEFDVEIAYTQGMHRSYEIRSDFPLTQSRTSDWEYGHGSPRKFIRGSGTAGAGTHTVKLSTVNGDIVIHSGG